MVRVKHRYFLVEIIPNGFPSVEACSRPVTVTSSGIFHSVLNAVETLHGDFGLAAISKEFKAKYLNPDTRIVILRCARVSHKFVSTSLPLVSKIGKINASLHLLHLGGTIRSCNKFLIDYHRKQLFRKYKSCTPVEKAEFNKIIETYQLKSDWKF